MLDGIQGPRHAEGGCAAATPVNREALADIIIKGYRSLVSDFPEIVELDLNPVFAHQEGCDPAADVRIGR